MGHHMELAIELFSRLQLNDNFLGIGYDVSSTAVGALNFQYIDGETELH
jgi:hypothetical protein